MSECNVWLLTVCIGAVGGLAVATVGVGTYVGTTVGTIVGVGTKVGVVGFIDFVFVTIGLYA